MTQEPKTAVAAVGITRRFPGVVANDRVELAVARGEVHALLGENGSGKSTLCKVLTGFHRPDEGHVEVEGRRVELRSPGDAYAAGIFMVHQHFSLVEPLTVAENVVLGWARDAGLRHDPRRAEEEVAAAADELDIRLDPRARIWQLSVGERQRVEILKALYRGARTLILDEPTTVLTPRECDQLFATLRLMAERGNSVIFISHKLPEVIAVCDRVTVLRNGRVSGVASLADGRLEPRDLARMMIGRDVELVGRKGRARSSVRTELAPALELHGISAASDVAGRGLHDVSLSVHPGELVGIVGVAGNGQRELAEVVAGLRRPSAGTVAVEGRALRPGRPRAAIQAGLAYVPEDRLGTGLAPDMTVADNIILKDYRSPSYATGPFIRSKRAFERATELLEKFDVRGRPSNRVGQLSGGNAQKVLLARELSSDPRVLVVAAPTRGLDVAAMHAIRTSLAEAAGQGVAVLLISEDLDEALDLSDRVAVMYDGRILGELHHAEFDRDRIGLWMAGIEGGGA